jgi:hypothetical protein
MPARKTPARLKPRDGGLRKCECSGGKARCGAPLPNGNPFSFYTSQAQIREGLGTCRCGLFMVACYPEDEAARPMGEGEYETLLERMDDGKVTGGTGAAAEGRKRCADCDVFVSTGAHNCPACGSHRMNTSYMNPGAARLVGAMPF